MIILVGVRRPPPPPPALPLSTVHISMYSGGSDLIFEVMENTELSWMSYVNIRHICKKFSFLF